MHDNPAEDLFQSTAGADPACVVVVDDDPLNHAILRKPLKQAGYHVIEAATGEQALRYALEHNVDAILLDVMLPRVDGFELCRILKRHERTRHVPVLMVTALSEKEQRLRGIESGANDFLTKPVDTRELMLRVKNAVYSKQLYNQLQAEQLRSEKLLNSLLPPSIVDRIRKGEREIADKYPDVTVLLAELLGFNELTEHIATEQVVYLLDEIFTAFDQLVENRALEKIRTFGASYLLVAGAPIPRRDHALAAAELALDMSQVVEAFNERNGLSLQIHVVLNSGPAVAGVIGCNKSTYDIWGATINQAWRLAAAARTPGVLATASTRERLAGMFAFEECPDRNAARQLFRLAGRAGEVLPAAMGVR